MRKYGIYIFISLKQTTVIVSVVILVYRWRIKPIFTYAKLVYSFQVTKCLHIILS